jgi:hypothetical protein
MNEENHERMERIVESVWVRLLARGAMIGATIALPLVGTLVAYFGNRTMVSLDEAVKLINETSARVLVLQQQITDSGIVYATNEMQLKAQIEDHETRLRVLEHLSKK